MMKKITKLTKTLLVAAGLLVGTSAWATPIETVGTEGSGDVWDSRQFSSAYELPIGKTYHFSFVNHNYSPVNNWNNWYLMIGNSNTNTADPAYLTLRSDKFGWGANYDASTFEGNYAWDSFKNMMNGATVDLYVNFSNSDYKIRTYATITGSDAKQYYYYNTTTALDSETESVFLFLSEELAYLEVNTAELVTDETPATTYLFSRSSTANCFDTWTDADITGWTKSWASMDAPTIEEGLKLSQGNAGNNISMTISPKADNIINLEATFLLKGGTGANTTGQNFAFFRYGNIYITHESQDKKSYYTLNGAPATGAPGTQFYSSSVNADYRDNGLTYRVLLEINTKTNTLNYMRIYVNGASTASLDISNQALTSYDYSTISFGFVKNRTASANVELLKDITISQTVQSVQYADYTVHFVDNNGATVKEDAIRSGEVGSTANANSDDQTTFYSDGSDYKYVYNSDGGGVVVKDDGTSEFTVVYNKFAKFTATASAINGGSSLKSNIGSATAYADETATIFLPKYIEVDGIWYTTSHDLYVSATEAGDTEIEYTSSNVNHFFEFESMTISRTYGDGYTGTEASSGRAITLYGGANAYTASKVSAGVFTISLNGKVWQSGYTDTYEVAYSTDQTNWIPVGNISYADGEEGIKTLAGAIIPTSSYIRIRATMGSQTPRRHLDYLALEKTADLPTTVSATMGTNGFTTFSSAYNLDLANLPAGVKAYTATLTETTLSFAECTKAVPAATGLLLAGDASTSYDIPVTTEAADAVTGNALIAAVTATSKQSTEGGMYYFVMKAGSDPLAFAPISTTKAVTIPAGKAYVELNTATGARSLTVTFGDDTTGIQTVANVESATENYYNLSGQRVANPAKGLYIVNGKKVIIK